jgi:thiamine transporter ThiT
MKTIGLILGIMAALGMLLAFIPLLGWLNWVNIPFAMVGFIISALGKSRPGLLLSGAAILFGLLRLMLGGGIL